MQLQKAESEYPVKRSHHWLLAGIQLSQISRTALVPSEEQIDQATKGTR
jgi:hypothetical protein